MIVVELNYKGVGMNYVLISWRMLVVVKLNGAEWKTSTKELLRMDGTRYW